jgi:hypothetical protein
VWTAVVATTLVSDRIGFAPDGKVQPDPVIAARRRFDLQVARAMRDLLNVMIDLLSPPKSQMN